MKFSQPKWTAFLTAFAASVAFSTQLVAQDLPATVAPEVRVAPRTEADLLDALSQADAAEALRIDRELQSLWSKSGSSSMDLLLKRGRDALEADDLAAAIEHLTALTDHAPDFAEGWHLRASAFYRAEMFGPAVADLERALALNPNNYNAMMGLGAILETFGDPDRAYEAYLRAKAVHPHYEEVTKALERLQSDIEGRSL
jgi:tetratricopeptide (TPR) repeat protein